MPKHGGIYKVVGGASHVGKVGRLDLEGPLAQAFEQGHAVLRFKNNRREVFCVNDIKPVKGEELSEVVVPNAAKSISKAEITCVKCREVSRVRTSRLAKPEPYVCRGCRLPKRNRRKKRPPPSTLLRLRDEMGMTYRDVGKQFGVSPDTARRWIRDAPTEQIDEQTNSRRRYVNNNDND